MKYDIEIQQEDRVKLTNDQKNLLTLALEKQLPVADAEFLEDVKKNTTENLDSYVVIKKYFTDKYGSLFGVIYLAAITDGEEGCKNAINDLETSNAEERIRRENSN